jgi:putative ABC transport system permease protein
MMNNLWQDVRYAIRMLAKRPGFTVIAVITLALGIGANSAIFSVVHAVLLRPLPFERPEELVRLTSEFQNLNVRDAGLSVPELYDYRERAGVFDAVSGVYPLSANITWVDQPERVEALLVDVNYFSLLGVNAQLGRVFQPEDYQPGITEVAVISDALWRRRYGADPDVCGKQFRLDNDMYTVIGVMPRDFRHPGRAIQTEVEVWAPSGWSASPFAPDPPRGAYFLQGAIARLKPGVTLAAAQRRISEMARELRNDYPKDYPETNGWQPRVIGLQDSLVGNVRDALLILFGAVGLVLLIACANVANLLLVRASARQREIAIRRALGASRSRLIRQMLTESVLLAMAGGVLGLLVAVWGVEALVSFSPTNISRLGDIGLDRNVLVFTIAVSLVTGLVFGLVPAIQASNPNLQETLKDAARGAIGSASRNRMRNLLVVSEFALALMLLIAASLLIRSFWHLQNVDTGFDSKNVLTAQMWLPQPNLPETGPYFKHAARVALYKQVIDRVSNLPGVERAAGLNLVPLSGSSSNVPFTVEGQPPDTPVNLAKSFTVSTGYFDTLRIRLLKGRLFAETDDEKAPRVAVISQAMAERVFPGADPIEKRIKFGGPQSQAPWLTIIGVVKDVKSEGLDKEERPQLYRPLLQASNLNFALVIRAATDPAALADGVRREVQSLDADLPVFAFRTMDELVASVVSDRRFAMVLLGVFAALALVLSAVGIYGVMSYSVTQRTHEIGVRMALGASSSDVLRLIFAQASRLVFLGTVIGLAGAIAATRFLRFLLFAVTPTDLATFAAITPLLGLVALAACYFPARRATRVDPMVALHYE